MVSKILKNNNGSSLGMVMVTSGVILFSSMAMMNSMTSDSKIQGTQLKRSVTKVMDNRIDTYLSSAQNCMKHFQNIAPTQIANGRSAFSLAAAEASIKGLGLVPTEQFDFKLDTLKGDAAVMAEYDDNVMKGKMVENVVRDIALTRYGATLKYRVLDKSINSAQSFVEKEIPMIFDFYQNSQTRRTTLFSCYADSAPTDMAESSCQMIGGKFIANEKQCKLEAKHYTKRGNTYVFSNKYNNVLSSGLCQSELGVKRQPHSHRSVNPTGNPQILTSKCAKPDWGGCTVNGRLYNQGQTHRYKESHKKPQKFIEKVYQAGATAQYERVLQQIAANNINVTPAGINASFSGVSPNTDHILLGIALGGVPTASIAGLAALGPGGVVGGLVLAALDMSCSKKYEVYVTNKCVNGKWELARIEVNRSKFKKSKMKCKRKTIARINGPTDFEIADLIL